VGQPAHGVRTEGLRYPLNGETLHPGSTRGVSNELVEANATIKLASGVLLALLPIAEED
jgi:thiamine pyrophosphokinase